MTLSRQHEPRFEGCGWSAEHIRDFVEVLPLFTELRELDLSANKFGSEGATIFASALQVTLPHQTSFHKRSQSLC